MVGRIAHDVEIGLVPAAQVAVALQGELIVAAYFGTATASSRLPLYSVSKVLPAAAIWRLVSTGDLRFDQLVVDHLPWFTGAGKEAVRVEHLLLHTAGLANAPLGPPAWFDPVERRAKMASWYTSSPPGELFAYHPTSASWVLTELLAALTGRDHCSAIEQLVTEPLGLPRLIGIDDRAVPVCDAELVGAASGELNGAGPELTIENLLQFNDSDVRRLGVPGAGGFARAADIAMLYQALLHDERALWDPDVLADVTGTVRVTQFDELRGVSANRTRGLICAGDDGKGPVRGFGTHCSPAAFGHDGAAGQVAWGDPATGLSCCFVTAGLDADVLRQYRRSIGISNRAAAIAGSDPGPTREHTEE